MFVFRQCTNLDSHVMWGNDSHSAFLESMELLAYVKTGEISHKNPDFWFLSENWKVYQHQTIIPT